MGYNPVPVEGRRLKKVLLSVLYGLIVFFQMITRQHIPGRRGARTEVGGRRDQRGKIKIYV